MVVIGVKWHTNLAADLPTPYSRCLIVEVKSNYMQHNNSSIQIMGSVETKKKKNFHRKHSPERFNSRGQIPGFGAGSGLLDTREYLQPHFGRC